MIGSMELEATNALARGFKALGDPTRLRIVAVLAGGTRCVCEIQEIVDVPPNLLSHHLKVLREAGLIDGERRGRWIDYRLEPAALRALAAAVPPDAGALGLDVDACTVGCGLGGADA